MIKMKLGIENRVLQAAFISTVVGLSALAVESHAEKKKVPVLDAEQYSNINTRMWAYYGEMWRNIGIMGVTCEKGSKHYDSKLCEEAMERYFKSSMGYVNTSREVHRQPHRVINR